MYAIDLFCGAGGFSEGIIQAGFHIVFSSDRSIHVKETYENRHKQLGLIQGENTHFELADIRDLTGDKIFSCINKLKLFYKKPLTEIDAIFGGPPCQGFSKAGKRDKDDPRNMLFREYIRIISEVGPKYVVMENVDGIMSMELNEDFDSVSGKKYPNHSLVPDVLQSELEYLGYHVEKPKLLNASDYGVPQRRVRAIFIASRKDMVQASYPEPKTKEIKDKITVEDAIGDLYSEGNPSKYALKLRKGRTPHFKNRKPVSNLNGILNHEMSTHSTVIQERFSLFGQGESTKHVIEKLRINGLEIVDYPALFNELVFNANKEQNIEELKLIIHSVNPNAFLSMSEKAKDKRINSLSKKIMKNWLIEIKPEDKKIKEISKDTNLTPNEFYEVFVECKEKWNRVYTREQIRNIFKNQYLEISDKLVDSLLTKKDSRIRLDSKSTAPTMLTLPDDFIHPFLDRILTVREMARIQGFDDSFQFLGKRTTGGDKRKDEVPQYTQVGNAVPPLLAFAIASEIKKALIMTNQQNQIEREHIVV
jgi:DNA (cytosine-5)-methyltransferase 1